MILLPDAQFLIHRDDLNHPTVSGNKLHKLTPNIAYAKEHAYKTLLSFGGPFSNHLHAMAYACQKADLRSIGIVRGELQPGLSATLNDCQEWGMQLIGISRKNYRLYQDQLNQNPELALDIRRHFPELANQIDTPESTLMIPEGGSNKAAIASLCYAYRPLFKQKTYADISHVVCATGTGATVAGLCLAAPKTVKVIGVQAVAEGEATLKRIKQWIGTAPSSLSIIEGHCGGFAKTTPELNKFIDDFEQQRGIPIDPVYNAKTLYAISQMQTNGVFTSSDKVLIIHTGGLQGKRGFASNIS